MSFKPSVQQEAYFNWIQNESGSCILEAVAGSGKTTTIVNGLEFMTGKIFLGAFNKLMADELQERTSIYPNVKASTFHSAGFTSLRSAYGKQFELKIDEKKTRKIADSVVEKRPDLKPLVGAVLKIVSLAKNSGFGAVVPMGDTRAWQEMIDHYDLDSDLPEDARLDQIIPFAQVVLTKSNRDLNTIDFDDMVYLPIEKKTRMFQYDWVLIDEAQDTNVTRRTLAQKMLKPSGRLVAVGDPYQAIFGFTGADNNSLELIARDFKAKRLPLSVTYRCPKLIVAHARKWVSHITAADHSADGVLAELECEKLYSKVEIGDAIICRFNKYLVKTTFALIRRGVPAKMEGRKIGEGLVQLCDRWKCKNLYDLRDKLEAYCEKETTKAQEKEQDDKVARIQDQVETMYVLIDRAEEMKLRSVEELKQMILGLFEDGVSKKCVALMSIHKSKGLEFDRVYYLGREELHARASQPWMEDQERNLTYVAITRAKKELYEVTGVTAEFNRKK